MAEENKGWQTYIDLVKWQGQVSSQLETIGENQKAIGKNVQTLLEQYWGLKDVNARMDTFNTAIQALSLQLSGVSEECERIGNLIGNLQESHKETADDLNGLTLNYHELKGKLLAYASIAGVIAAGILTTALTFVPKLIKAIF